MKIKVVQYHGTYTHMYVGTNKLQQGYYYEEKRLSTKQWISSTVFIRIVTTLK